MGEEEGESDFQGGKVRLTLCGVAQELKTFIFLTKPCRLACLLPADHIGP